MNNLKSLISRLGLEDKIGVRSVDEANTQPLMVDETKLPENVEKQEQDLARKQDMINRIKQYENSIEKGKDPVTGRWFPHKSLEGGKDTLAYGDKLIEGKYSPEELDRFYKYGMSQEEVDDALIRNIEEAERGAQRIMSQKGIKGLDPVQQEALTEMVYQMGTTGTLGFKNMLAALQRGDYNRAYKEAMDSKWAQSDSPKRAQEVARRLKFGKLADRMAKK